MPSVLAAVRTARIESMILVEGEILASTDAFPVLYDDIKRNHIVLRGADPFADLVISDRHRRLRVAQVRTKARPPTQRLRPQSPPRPRSRSYLRGVEAL